MTRRVVVVGGGAAGTLVAIHLANQANRETEVTVVEPRPRLGEGVAYSTRDESHLLNVPAGGMSIYPNDALHFARWAESNEGDYVPRRRYAAYLRDELVRLQREKRKVTLRHVRLPAIAVATSPLSVDVVGERIQIGRAHV